MAVRENLAVRVAETRVLSARANARSWALEAPMVAWLQVRDPVNSANGFEIQQKLPFPTKISHGREARKLEFEARTAERKSTENEIRALARLVYFQVWQRQQRVRLLQEKKRAIEDHVKLATAGARSDSFQKIHIIKAESDLDFLANEILQASQDAREMQIEAARFVNEDPERFLLAATELPLTPIPNENLVTAALQLQVPKLELAAGRSRQREAEASWFPDLNLRYRQMESSAMSAATSEIMLGFSLPFLFFWEAQSISERGAAEAQVAEYKLRQEEQKFAAERALLFSRARSLQKQLTQIQEKLLPRAEKRMRLVHNLAPRDLEILQDHRETMEAFPDLKLKSLDLRTQYEAVVADLKKFEAGSEK